MFKLRVAAVAAVLACATMLVDGASARAQTGPARMTQVVPLSGAAKNGKKLTAKYTIERFVARGGKLYSVGLVKGTLGGHHVSKDGVMLPASVANASAARTSQLPPLPPGNACSILSLDLGPVNLNLLGLVVRTNPIQLRIDAVQGAGNLLGNLLCGITGILNPSALSSTPLGQLAQVLNALLALSPRTG
jgi:hypothetical protein